MVLAKVESFFGIPLVSFLSDEIGRMELFSNRFKEFAQISCSHSISLLSPLFIAAWFVNTKTKARYSH